MAVTEQGERAETEIIDVVINTKLAKLQNKELSLILDLLSNHKFLTTESQKDLSFSLFLSIVIVPSLILSLDSLPSVNGLASRLLHFWSSPQGK